MKQPVDSNRTGLGAVVLLAMLAGALAAGFCVALYWREAGETEKTLREREVSRLGLFDKILTRDLKATSDDLRELADGDGLHAFLSSGQPADLDRASRRAAFFSRNEPDCDQVRYLDEHGQEIMRVNQGGAVVGAGQLRNTGSLPFFQQANALPPGAVYISPRLISTRKMAGSNNPTNPRCASRPPYLTRQAAAGCLCHQLSRGEPADSHSAIDSEAISKAHPPAEP